MLWYRISRFTITTSVVFFSLFITMALAFAGLHGKVRQVSSRVMINQNLHGQYDYAFINFLLGGDGFLSPVGLNFSSGTCYWANILDANGYPNDACANGLSFGGGIRFPSSAQFSEQYTLDGSGLGVMVLGIGTQFTLSTGVQCGGVASGVAPNNVGTPGSGWGWITASNGTIITNDTSGTGFCVPFTNVGQSTPQLSNIHINNTCSTTSGACVGAFIKNLRLYQQRDYARLALGKVFRTEYLQPIATMDPCCIRFMAWGPGDSYSGQIRYENRPSLTTTGGNSGANWKSGSPLYTVSSGTNLVSVAAVVGTPVAMKHGETATFRFGSSMNYGTSFGGVQVSAVSNANPGVITTVSPHGYATGDVVIHGIQDPTNMPKLNHYPVCITVTDTTHYSMQVFNITNNTCGANLNTTTWGTYSNTGSNLTTEYASLNVGARQNAPIVVGDGITPVMTYFLAAQGSYALNITYDKNSCAITDGTGTNICGVWMVSLSAGLCNFAGGVCGYESNTPLELEVKFINEVNELLIGGQQSVALWINIPHMSLVPTDPDYTIASDYSINMIKTIVNGTYPLCAGCPLIIENSNEWWNFGYPTFGYYSRQNFIRYGISGSSDFGTLRSIQMFEDIHNNSGVYNPTIMRFAMMTGPWTAIGDPNQVGSGSYIRLYGDNTIMNDVRWPNAASPPYAYFDAYGYAPYVNATAGFYTANFATMAANWCTGQATACALTPPFAPNCTGTTDATYCLPFVNGISHPLANPIGSDLATIDDQIYGDELFKKALYKIGKSFLQYEGGSNWSTCYTGDPCPSNNADGSSITTAAQRNFMVSIVQSASWATAWSNYCKIKMNDTSAGGCGNLLEITGPAPNFKWSLGAPDTFGSTLTEGAGLIQLWNSFTTINTGQP